LNERATRVVPILALRIPANAMSLFVARPLSAHVSRLDAFLTKVLLESGLISMDLVSKLLTPERYLQSDIP
jgi:Na+/pantothenate symporter